jgi:hypothetical protein
MINAIFIQSFNKEIENSKIQKLLNSLSVNLFDKKIKIILFLNFQSIKLSDQLSIPPELDADIIYVNEGNSNNPTTQIFHFMINFEAEKYTKILLLEADCHILKNFDESINNELLKFKNKKWLVLGSQYYGLNTWLNEPRDGKAPGREHINGVAVYNRCEKLLNLINHIIISNSLTQQARNYDYCLYEKYSDYKVVDQMIDSPLIVNISDAVFDLEITHYSIKPKAVIIHSKNPYYYN